MLAYRRDHGLPIPSDAAPEIDALKTERLRKALEAGIADLERGNYEEIDEADLDAWLDRLVDAPAPDASKKLTSYFPWAYKFR